MFDIFTVTAPIYLLILLGYGAVRLGWLAKADMRVLGQFVIRFAMPAMLFKTLSQRSVSDILNLRFLCAYALGSLAVFGVGWLWARRRPGAFAAFAGMGMAFSNSGFVGAPVLLQWLGPQAGVPLALAMVTENLLMLPLTLVVAELAERRERLSRGAVLSVLAPLARHPLILGIAAGFAWSALGWTLPPLFARAVDLLANASAAVALMVIGGSLVGLQVGKVRADLTVVALGKLVLHPLAVGALMAWWLGPDEQMLRAAAIALAAMPMLSIYPVLAQKYRHEGFTAGALMVTTMSSFFTLSALLWALQRWVMMP